MMRSAGIFTLAAAIAASASAADPLPSWNEGLSKSALVRFVGTTTTPGSDGFIPVEERIAVFDNDGTLWSEQPYYNQVAFAIERIRALAPGHPEWKDRPPFRDVLRGDVRAVMASSPRERPYTELVYRPMRELLDYLNASGFRTFIVSGGGIEFMRPWTERAYGIAPERVIGSSIKLKYEPRGDQPAIIRLPEIDFIDDGPGKPIGIQRHIGRRPVLAFGNSDGDEAMLRWTTAGAGPRLGLILHHTDARREWAYDRNSPVGRLDRALDEAPGRGWVVVDMKTEWKRVFVFEE